MKRMMIMGAAFTLSIMLCGCARYQYHSHTQSRDLSNDYVLKLNIVSPLALKNTSSSSPGIEAILCQYGTVDVMGNLYDLTESAIGTAKNALQKQKATIDDKAEKKLELSVYKATCDKGWNFRAMVSLRVQTGSGIMKEYQGLDSFSTGYQTTAGFEMAFVQCIEQMLKDKEIVAYIEK